jgi:ABC-type branched-subunit amino acid transport system substrate-binding protein
VRLLLILLFLALFANSSFSQSKDEGVIKIGLLVSEDPAEDSISLSAVHGAEVAISLLKANVKLIVRSCDGPWGVTSKQMVDFVYEDEVDAIITSVDGRNAHLAEQVATKAQKTLICARATDPTLTQAFVPWFFRITPDDKKQAKALKEEIFEKQKLSHVIVIHPSNYNGSYAMDHFIKELEAEQHSNTEVIFYDPLTYNFQKIVNILNDKDPQGVVFLGRASYTSRLIKEVYEQVPDIKLFGNQSIVESGVTMNSLPGNIWVATSSDWPSDDGELFVERFYEHHNYKPGLVAAHTQDALTIIVNAIQISGSDHDKLHEQLKSTNYLGVTGIIQFDDHGNRSSLCKIAHLKDGKFVEKID